MSWVSYLAKVGLKELLRLLLLVRELQLQTSKVTIIFKLYFFVEIVHTLTDVTHDHCSQLGLLKKLGLRELVVSDCQLGLVYHKVVWFK